MHFLNKLEDFFVQLIRVVLLAFAIVVMVALGAYLVAKLVPEKASTAPESTVDWKGVQPDIQFVLEETGRDLGTTQETQSLPQRLADPQIWAAFQKADRLVRDFVAQQPEQHARTEAEHDARGLAAVHPLLAGSAAPDAQAIQAYEQAQSTASAHAQDEDVEAAQSAEAQAADAAAQAVEAAAQAVAVDTDSEASDSCCWSEPVDVAQMLHTYAMQAQSEYAEPAYRAFVQGAPAAMERVLSDPGLAPKLHELSITRLVETILTNYSISFSRAVNGQDSDDNSIWDAAFSSLELTLWSVILSFLVLVVFVVMAIRMEKHLRVMSLQQQPPAR